MPAPEPACEVSLTSGPPSIPSSRDSDLGSPDAPISVVAGALGEVDGPIGSGGDALGQHHLGLTPGAVPQESVIWMRNLSI